MRRCLSVLTALLLLAAPAAAADLVTIDAVRVGFPAVTDTGETDEAGTGKAPLFKAGAWVPLIVSLTANGPIDGQPELVVQSADNDDLPTSFRQPLPTLEPGRSEPFVSYTRPGGTFAEITVRVRLNDRDIAKPQTVTLSAQEPGTLLYLTLGSRLPGLKLPGPPVDPSNRSLSGAPLAVQGAVTEVGDLPTQWFGYEGVDLVILLTSGAPNDSFIARLANDQSGRREALAEWVRRGGHLAVSVAGNATLFSAMPELAELLPVTLDGTQSLRAGTQLAWLSRERLPDPIREPLRPAKGGDVIARAGLRAKPDRDVETAMVLNEGERAPVVVRSAYGLGRVTVVGLEIDRPPFTTWDGRNAFWTTFLPKAGPAIKTNIALGDGGVMGSMLNFLGTPEGVPVVSFGWVALFILAYIIVVGPLDYLFLKYVVGRLELTWITFPTVVLAVSVAAYLTAYAIKGNDLKVNKLDVVDIDQSGPAPTAYGQSWWSIFSPRIEAYTVGLEPTWGAEPPADTPSTTLVSWAGVPGAGGINPIRRTYEYAPRATGLIGVPIQVWSTKAFTAAWSRPLGDDPATWPVAGELRRVRDGEGVTGEITSNLPAGLIDPVLLYAGKAYPIGVADRVPGQKVLLPASPERVTLDPNRDGEAADIWLSRLSIVRPVSGGTASAEMRPASLLFAERGPDVQAHQDDHLGRGGASSARVQSNAGVRGLDQSWRLRPDHRGEAILVGRFESSQGPSEEVVQGPESPTQLWLGALPGGQTTRPALPGQMRQWTYVRVYLPVLPARK